MTATTAIASPSAVSTAARVARIAAMSALAALAALHALSPEFAPSWRAVSEYANGNYSWALSLMFVSCSGCW
jgi:CelD/BcsL family acetyltransferase involved in cellulose biosynthesis